MTQKKQQESKLIGFLPHNISQNRMLNSHTKQRTLDKMNFDYQNYKTQSQAAFSHPLKKQNSDVKTPGISRSINLTNKNLNVQNTNNNMYMPHHLVSLQDLNISSAQQRELFKSKHKNAGDTGYYGKYNNIARKNN